MRKTHYDYLMETPLGKIFEESFSMVRPFDTREHVVEERIFDQLFSAQYFENATGTPAYKHAVRTQRKLDLSIVQHVYHLWRDKNFFDLSPKLCDKLMDTDLRDLDTFFLKAPYRSLYLSIPKGTGMYAINDESCSKHELMGIYLLFDEFPEDQQIQIASTGQILSGIKKYVHILACGELDGRFNDCLVFFQLLFWDGKISESLARSKEYLPHRPDLQPFIDEIFAFVVKVLVYLNCANSSIQKIAGFDLEAKVNGLKNPAKKRKLLQRYEKLSLKPHKLLDVVIDHTPHLGEKSSSTGSGGPLGPKSLERVRGHFKVQHYGVGYSQSKVIWIEPYIRGSDAEYFREERRYKVN